MNELIERIEGLGKVNPAKLPEGTVCVKVDQHSSRHFTLEPLCTVSELQRLAAEHKALREKAGALVEFHEFDVIISNKYRELLSALRAILEGK